MLSINAENILFALSPRQIITSQNFLTLNVHYAGKCEHYTIIFADIMYTVLFSVVKLDTVISIP